MSLLKFTEEKPRVILFAGSNMVANQIFEFLINRKENLIHTFVERDNITTDTIVSYKPDIMITCYWPYLLSPEMIKHSKYGCINFHPALLPKNRGWYPSVWEVIEGGKAGVTLHLIDERADTGPIISQMEFPVKETDTGGTIYGRSQLAMISLFKQTWVDLFNGDIELTEQDHTQATYRRKMDANDLDEIDLNGKYRADYLFKLLKAKTFRDKSYAFYRKDGKKYSVRIEVKEENE